MSSSGTQKDAPVQKYYAVRAGVKPGVYLTWAECQEQTAGFRGASCACAKYKQYIPNVLT
ncbi:hypothetical protein K449DRAFT_390285 [Hypoxylon sp. EC38]|nr:hypothetical protein K449DRAFT_390285 [Hypoxylon sp. EC38]